MNRAIGLTRVGAPEVLEWQEVPEPIAEPGELCVRHTAVGVNFIDTYHRSGLYPLALPSRLGQEAVGVTLLAAKGSLYLTRPTLFEYTKTRGELVASAESLFDAMGSGAVKPVIGQTFPLFEVARAHRALEARATTGSTVLVP